MSATQQGIAARRKARQDPRYRQNMKDAARREIRQRMAIEREKERVTRKGAVQ